MTVCIACLADDGKSVVAGTDAMMTYPIGGGVVYNKINTAHNKLTMVNPDVAIMVAGTVDEATVVLSMAGTIGEKERPLEVAQKILRGYEKFLKDKQERTVLTPAGLTWDQYLKHQNQLQPIVAKDIHDKLQNVNVGCEIVVAGFDKSSNLAYVGVISGNVLYDRNVIGIALAGNGFSIANMFLAQKAYRKSLTRSEVETLVKEAIEEAAHAPGVGGVGKVVIVPARP